jgi:nitroreductase
MLEILEKRHSVRNYSDRKVEDRLIEEILRAAMTAPTAHNSRSWEFVVVRQKDLIQKLAQAGKWISFAEGAQVIIVIVGNEQVSDKWIENCTLAAGFIYLEATNQGLGTCWAHVREGKTENGEDSEEYVKNLLDIPSDKRVLCLMPLGYPAEGNKPQRMKTLEKDKIHSEKW